MCGSHSIIFCYTKGLFTLEVREVEMKGNVLQPPRPQQKECAVACEQMKPQLQAPPHGYPLTAPSALQLGKYQEPH